MKEAMLWTPIIGIYEGLRRCLDENQYDWPAGTPKGVLHTAYQGVCMMLLLGYLLKEMSST